jgi:hypothetical protein
MLVDSWFTWRIALIEMSHSIVPSQRAHLFSFSPIDPDALTRPRRTGQSG